MKRNYTKIAAFINRKEEINYLETWISQQPESILFIYGPKSSGKTTLLYKFVEENLNNKEFDIKYFNLRKILITNYKDFIKVFFEKENKIASKETKRKHEYDLKVFKLSIEIIKLLEEKELDPFVVMDKELQKLEEKGIRPVIIIDELQALNDIYMAGQRELLKELFNFFVAMTKESHLCHIIISSSDAYFIERIYNDSKLIKTSSFFEVDYLPKEDVLYWLNNLEKESRIRNLTLTNKQIEKIWYYFGGSVWEISKFLSSLIDIQKNNKVTDEQIKEEAGKIIKAYSIRFNDYLGIYYDEKLFVDINKILKEKDCVKLNNLVPKYEKRKIMEELGKLVQNNLFSYNPMTGEYKPQGHSVKLGLQMYCEELIR